MDSLKTKNKKLIPIIVLLIVGCSTLQWQSEPPELSIGNNNAYTNGALYGAFPSNIGPFGGGEGYDLVFDTGDYLVATEQDLLDALARARSGSVVFIPGNVVLDFSSYFEEGDFTLFIREGVVLASDRGLNGSSGALIRSLYLDTPGLITVGGTEVRITGLRIEGPDKLQRNRHHYWSFVRTTKEQRALGIDRERYYSIPNSRGITTDFGGLTVDNCQIFGFSHAAIYLRNGVDHHIHHNYIHHNQRKGLGYGISHHTAYSLIEYNVFNYNRHAVAGTGALPSGYTARNNIILSSSSSHVFDMHGGGDRRDGTNTAGERIVIENNTFFSSAVAVGIRGRPDEYAIIRNNWFYQPSMSKRVLVYWPPADTVLIKENAYGARQE